MAYCFFVILRENTVQLYCFYFEGDCYIFKFMYRSVCKQIPLHCKCTGTDVY